MSYLKVAGINHPSATTGGLAISSGGIVTGGGLDYITSSAFTTASTVSVDGCFTSTYDTYRLALDLTAASGNVNILMRLRLAGTDSSSANYSRQTITSLSTTTTSAVSTGQTQWYIGDVYSALPEYSAVEATVYRPAKASMTTAITRANALSGGGDIEILETASTHTLTTAYDGFTLYPSSGTITGTLTVYGYRKA